MAGKLDGRRAIITGAGSGLGEAIAKCLASEGARVAIFDVNRSAGERVAHEIVAAGGTARAYGVDVTDDAQVGRAVAESIDQLGGLDILVNNAGIAQPPCPTTEIDPALIDRLFAVNVRSLYHLMHHALPALNASSQGAVINVASSTGIRPARGSAWYSASKAAVMSLTESLAVELAPRIRVNAVAPSLADTPMKGVILGAEASKRESAARASFPLGRLAEGTDVASAVLFLASSEAAFITGAILPVDGGRAVA